jgi:hypothetical protein
MSAPRSQEAVLAFDGNIPKRAYRVNPSPGLICAGSGLRGKVIAI